MYGGTIKIYFILIIFLLMKIKKKIFASNNFNIKIQICGGIL